MAHRFIRFRKQQAPAPLPTLSPDPLVSSSRVSAAESPKLSLNVETALDIAVRAAAQNTGATAVAIALMEKDVLVCRARLGDIAPDVGVALNVSTGITGACVRAAQVLKCDDTQKDDRVDADVCRNLGIRSILVIPILADGVVVGILEALSDRPGAFAPLHVHWLDTVARFVHDLACGGAVTRIGKPPLGSPTASLSVANSPSAKPSDLPASPDSLDRSVPQLEGIAALRHVLDKASEASSWDEICEQLISRMKE